MHRWRHTFMIFAIGAALLTTGCTPTAAANSVSAGNPSSASPSPASHATSTPFSDFDADVTRTFTADGTSATCTVAEKAVLDSATAGTDADKRVAAARKLLASQDWQAEPVTLAEMSADDQKMNRDRGWSDAAMLATVLDDHMTGALKAAGLMGTGVTTQGRVNCG
jgi:hypothetical protein